VQEVERSRPNPLDVTDLSAATLEVPNAAKCTHATHAGLGNCNFWAHPVLRIYDHYWLVVALTGNWGNSALNKFACTELACFAFANERDWRTLCTEIFANQQLE
jgi:hypothetical protein